MKKLIYDSALLLLGCLLWTGCNNDEDLTVYSTEGAKTELGQKKLSEVTDTSDNISRTLLTRWLRV